MANRLWRIGIWRNDLVSERIHILKLQQLISIAYHKIWYLYNKLPLFVCCQLLIPNLSIEVLEIFLLLNYFCIVHDSHSCIQDEIQLGNKMVLGKQSPEVGKDSYILLFCRKSLDLNCMWKYKAFQTLHFWTLVDCSYPLRKENLRERKS